SYKITYYSTVQHEVTNVHSGNHAAKVIPERNPASLHFIVFQNGNIETCLDFIKDHLMNAETKVIQATGEEHKVDEEDEMLCLIRGCNFVLRNIPNEAFVFANHPDSEFMFPKTCPDIFPYLLVNVGSGSSILKVESEDTFELLGGSLINGRTFWGLGKLLTQAKSFDELLQLASKGQCKNVDLLVKDIYDGSYLSYAENIIACSFGKSAITDQEFSKDDLAASLLHMISSHIGQLACLHAKLQNISRIYFGGLFISGHPSSKRSISNVITFLTKGDVQALFLRHEGYLTVIGASLRRTEDDIQHKGEVQRQSI
uniref:Pantothenate kinase 4 (inactive) n=1 Tax=Neogobius melanostomus TaxID=47308 RepID=A0A8C6S8T3_9GOBI